MKYTKPELNVIKFDASDVITTSSGLVLENYVAQEDGNNYQSFNADWLN